MANEAAEAPLSRSAKWAKDERTKSPADAGAIEALAAAVDSAGPNKQARTKAAWGVIRALGDTLVEAGAPVDVLCAELGKIAKNERSIKQLIEG